MLLFTRPDLSIAVLIPPGCTLVAMAARQFQSQFAPYAGSCTGDGGHFAGKVFHSCDPSWDESLINTYTPT